MTEATHSQTGYLQSRGAWGVWNTIRTASVPCLWFVFGIAIGTLMGSVAERGLASTFERISPAPIYSLLRLLMWGFGFLAVSGLWRFPRRLLIGKHDLGAVPCFLAGALTAALHYLVVVFLYDRGLMTINWSQSTTQVVIVMISFLVSAIVSVECEVCISRWMARWSQGANA